MPQVEFVLTTLQSTAKVRNLGRGWGIGGKHCNTGPAVRLSGLRNLDAARHGFRRMTQSPVQARLPCSINSCKHCVQPPCGIGSSCNVPCVAKPGHFQCNWTDMRRCMPTDQVFIPGLSGQWPATMREFITDAHTISHVSLMLMICKLGMKHAAVSTGSSSV